jgi:hypothetical protein
MTGSPLFEKISMKNVSCLPAVFFVAAFALSVSAADSQPRVLTEKEAGSFRDIVVNRETKRENYRVLERLIAEKRSFFKTVAETLAKDHQVASDASYTYTAADKTLYLLSTNGVAKGKDPKKVVVKKFKSDADSLPLRKLMASRLQTESQLAVLAVLAEENRQEMLGWDSHLYKTFNLKTDVRYQIKKRDDGKYELVELSEKRCLIPKGEINHDE